MIQKPIDLVIEDFRNMMVNSINNSNLPLSVSTMIMEDVTKMAIKELQKTTTIAKEKYYAEVQAEQIKLQAEQEALQAEKVAGEIPNEASNENQA